MSNAESAVIAKPEEDHHKVDQNSVQELTLPPETTKKYQQKAIRAFMWLSADMKQWLSKYGSSPEQITQKVKEYPINAKLKEYDEMLTLFSKVLRLEALPKRDQEDAMADWDDFVVKIKKSPKNEYFEVFQDLPVDGENIDSNEFVDEIKAFKHDLMSPTGASGLVTEYNLIQSEPALAPLSDSIKNLNYRFDEVRQKMRTMLDTQVDKRTQIPPEAVAKVIDQLNTVLHAFNLESGGEITGDVAASKVWEYIHQIIGEVGSTFVGVTIDKENRLSEEDMSKQVSLNKSIIFRLLLNTISNAHKSNPNALVTVTLAASEESLIVAVRDNGTGFPSETKEARVLLDLPIKLYQVAEGKTAWQSAKGTGSGLFGLSNLARKLGGELVTGNYYNGKDRQGAFVGLISPLRPPS